MKSVKIHFTLFWLTQIFSRIYLCQSGFRSNSAFNCTRKDLTSGSEKYNRTALELETLTWEFRQYSISELRQSKMALLCSGISIPILFICDLKRSLYTVVGTTNTVV